MGGRLDIWINMHILCCQSLMERYVQHNANKPCNLKDGEREKKLPSLSALFTLPIGNGSNSPLFKKRDGENEGVIANEPRRASPGLFLSREVHMKAAVSISQAREKMRCEVLSRLPPSVLAPPASASAGCSSTEGRVCLLPSRLDVISLLIQAPRCFALLK